MRLLRFLDEDGDVRYGVAREPRVAEVVEDAPFGANRPTGRTARVAKLLAPVDPPNLIGIGVNYRAHADETGKAAPTEPVVFVKLTTAVTHPNAPILLPPHAADEVDYEAELAVVIARTAHHVPASAALDHVLGYTCANDVTARDCQNRRDMQWARGKSFDTFCPLGEALITADEVDPGALPIRLLLNGKVMQESNTADMIFGVAELIGFLSEQFTLLPGTVILTGTPPGVGMARQPPVFLRHGDTVVVEIGGVGALSSPVIAL